ncbi:unnamed protein product [Ceratitis capitata]|uniref:(Mediterranean fruit fly) hypothetical protein n=1 Tax=Ceratitis capitata TaxID=7213 RepID=W8BMS4_CERCA|nr:unnamed protein product [Ceratitis capitata]
MPVSHSNENLAAGTGEDSNERCSICKQQLSSNQDCTYTNCNHTFHKTCLQNWLKDSQECPVCHRLCEISVQVRPQNSSRTNSSTKPNSGRGRPKGAIPRRHFTRASARYQDDAPNASLFQDLPGNLNLTLPDIDSLPLHTTGQERPSLNALPRTFEANSDVPPPSNNNIDYYIVANMIETSIQRMLSNINFRPDAGGETNTPLNRRQPQNDSEARRNSQPGHLSNNLNTSHFSTLSPEKITSIINNWNVKFDGSTNGLNVEEFLYRVRSLTASTLDNDFSLVRNNVHSILIGKARDWYWQFHKQSPDFDWTDFCTAIRHRYKDYKSDYDIREEIRNRKQKPGESFETFYDSITTIIARLSEPMQDFDLIETITRNLRPDVRHELLYVNIRSITHLRKLCQMRENLLAEEASKRLHLSRQASNAGYRRNIAELQATDGCANDDEIDTEFPRTIDALRKSEIRCWNCNEQGHSWQECIGERTIFCYGCGDKNVYKPQCTKCNPNRSENPRRGPFTNIRMGP